MRRCLGQRNTLLHFSKYSSPSRFEVSPSYITFVILVRLIEQTHELAYPHFVLFIVPSFVRWLVPRIPNRAEPIFDFLATAFFLWDVVDVFWFIPVRWITPNLNLLFYSLIDEKVYWKTKTESEVTPLPFLGNKFDSRR